ncbi:phage head-tail connector protein [Paludisphaera rhizosphaerae]|uniref:phage head-tail connector protein n=1 Tax=Paludisphaera rhizosphaerae TaxID=2711216 RepID=UPI0013EBA9AC|nr:phage head-tail connector protein [Paludisphaera rhizosphaerae]
MGLSIVAPPTTEPISLALAKQHARILVDDDDSYVGTLITAARQLAEVRCNRAFAPQTLDYTRDGFPGPASVPWHGAPYGWYGPYCSATMRAIDLPRPPLVEVESITYLDGAGMEQTLEPSTYRLATGTPGLVLPVNSQSWPATLVGESTVKVRYRVGFADIDIPESARLAMLMLIAQWYDRREPILTGSIVADLPWAVETLLESCSWRVSG